MNQLAYSKTERLISVIQELSLTRSIQSIRDIVKHAARELAGSDGATFVLRDNDKCYYVDEDAISPLWKGQRFPLKSCISGWVMTNKQTVIIKDIYQDSRIPIDAYRPTFVKSLTMVPIRTSEPIGAIGNYWKIEHIPTQEEVKLLEALANSTSIAIENVNVYSDLENRVKDRTVQLHAINTELEAFSYSVSHDLRAPVRIIKGLTQLILEDQQNKLSEHSCDLMSRIKNNTKRMEELIEDLLMLSKISKTDLNKQSINLSNISNDIINEFKKNNPNRNLKVKIEKDMVVEGDLKLIRILLENLIGNALKYTSKKPTANIVIGTKSDGAHLVIFIKDNGAGFELTSNNDLFRPFKRFHNDKEFPGTGIGLATVKRIINLYNGHIWVESSIGEGSTFYFYLS